MTESELGCVCVFVCVCDCVSICMCVCLCIWCVCTINLFPCTSVLKENLKALPTIKDVRKQFGILRLL